MKLVEIPGLADLGKDKPKVLFGLGKVEDKLFEKVVAIVGSRRITQYGKRVIEMMVPRLVEGGWTIVSGFMYGVDKTVHEEVIRCGGKTIAVLGWGLSEHQYEDTVLTKRILDLGGMIISEWEEQKGALWTFPRRNRIVAAISQGIYVVEAGVKSGSLITVELGEKLDREIWAVPGPITSKVSEGTNMLIATGRAKAWLPSLQVSSHKPRATELVGLLENEALSIDEMAIITGRLASEIGSELTMAQLAGEVVERGGKYYIGK